MRDGQELGGKIGEDDTVPEASKPECVATRSTANVQDPCTRRQVASDHPTIDGEFQRALDWIAESTPFTLTRVCVVLARLVVTHAAMVRDRPLASAAEAAALEVPDVHGTFRFAWR
jgi:hypothetical protein